MAQRGGSRAARERTGDGRAEPSRALARWVWRKLGWRWGHEAATAREPPKSNNCK